MKRTNKTIYIITAIALLLLLSSIVSIGFESTFAQKNTENTSSISNTATSSTSNASSTFSASGKISSLIFVIGGKPSNTSTNASSVLNNTTNKFILSGNWSLDADNGVVTQFKGDFIKVLENGTRWHTHDITNFKPAGDNKTKVQLTPDHSIPISGNADVKLNNTLPWKNVNTNIIISKGKTITIKLDNQATSNHFLGQSINGIVESIKDANGNEMLKAQQKAVNMMTK